MPPHLADAEGREAHAAAHTEAHDQPAEPNAEGPAVDLNVDDPEAPRRGPPWIPGLQAFGEPGGWKRLLPHSRRRCRMWFHLWNLRGEITERPEYWASFNCHPGHHCHCRHRLWDLRGEITESHPRLGGPKRGLSRWGLRFF